LRVVDGDVLFTQHIARVDDTIAEADTSSLTSSTTETIPAPRRTPAFISADDASRDGPSLRGGLALRLAT